MLEIKVKIDGMACSMCESHICDVIRKNFDVKKVSASHRKGEAVILSEETSIGRAIAKSPDILLCDEPTGALDYSTSKEILKLIENINRKYGNKSSFMNRYRTRILLQNIPSYLILFFGIFFGGAICIFGSMFGPLCEDYKNLVTQEQICNYQYVLNEEKEINDPNAEKFCIESLDTMVEEYITDSVTIYGVENSGKYVKQDIPDGQVLISNGIAEKFKLGKGDELTLKEKYSNKTYTFKIAGIYEYSGVLSVFMPRDNFNSTFDESQEHFSGYFSNRELTQLSSDDIAMSVTSQDLTKMAIIICFNPFLFCFTYS